MKKYFMLLAAAATVFAVSCNKSREVEGEKTQEPTPVVVDDSTPVPVLFGSNIAAVKGIVETKGVGGIDAWRAANQQPLYIYGMERVQSGQYAGKHVATKWSPAAGDEFTPFIDNVAAVAPDPNGNPAATGSRDAINVYNKYANTATEPYYYVQGKVYDFYGYYVDDAMGYDQTPEVIQPEPFITPVLAAEGDVIESIVLQDLTLDGSQDIMVAQTDKDADWALRSEYVSLEMLYSDRAARRDVKPDLVFTHELARFEFHIFNGGTIANNNLTITGLNLASYTKAKTGDLTIYPETSANYGYVANNLAGNFDPDAPDYTILDYFPLREETATLAAGDTVKTAHPVSLDNNGKAIVVTNPNEAGYSKVGESIMIAAGEASYDIQLFLNQAGVTAPGFNPAEQHLTIDMTKVKDAQGNPVGTGVSEKGKKYVVSLIIYGLEQIQVTVTLTNWDEAGKIEIDPDEDPIDERLEATITAPASLTVREGAQLIFGEGDYIVTSNNKYSDFEFASSDPAKFTVDEKGNITGVAAGTANLIINQPQSVSHLAADPVEVPVTVTADERPTLTITAADITMPLRDSKGYYSTKRFRETIQEGTGDPQHEIGEKTYTSADPAVATVDAKTGVITAAGEGTTTVTLTIAENEFYKESTCTINVEITVARQASAFTVDPIDIDWADFGNTDGGTIEPTAVIGDGDFTYAVKSGNSVTVNETTGALTIAAVGETVITVTIAQTATYETLSKDVTVTVNDDRLANTLSVEASSQANPLVTVDLGDRLVNVTSADAVCAGGEGSITCQNGSFTIDGDKKVVVDKDTVTGIYGFWIKAAGDDTHKPSAELTIYVRVDANVANPNNP